MSKDRNCDDFNQKIEINFDEYKKIGKYFPYKFKKTFIFFSILTIIFFSIGLIPPDPLTIYDVVIMSVFFIVGFYIILKIIDVFTRKFCYKKMVYNALDNLSYYICFYDDFFEKKGKNITQKIEYKNIWKLEEIENNIYILIDKNNIIPISKDKINKKLLNNIKEKLLVKNKKVYISMLDDTNNHKKNKRIKIILDILFILTIMSIWIGLWCMALLMQRVNAPAALIFKYSWGLFFGLPIPILSIILGFIYKKSNVQSTKNIIIGFVISALLISVGSISFMMNTKVEYSEIYLYEHIIKINIPKEGEFDRIEWDESYLMNHITEYVTFKNKKEANNFYIDVINSEIWILKDDISSNLSNFVPTSLICVSKEEPCYYSVYFKELNSHNSLPINSGNYNVYAMMYDPSANLLTIERFLYEYKN